MSSSNPFHHTTSSQKTTYHNSTGPTLQVPKKTISQFSEYKYKSNNKNIKPNDDKNVNIFRSFDYDNGLLKGFQLSSNNHHSNANNNSPVINTDINDVLVNKHDNPIDLEIGKKVTNTNTITQTNTKINNIQSAIINNPKPNKGIYI